MRRAPLADQPRDPVGPPGFRWTPSIRDAVLDPGGVSLLSQVVLTSRTCCLRLQEQPRPPRFAPFRGSLPAPHTAPVYASSTPLPAHTQDSVLPGLLDFGQVGLSPTNFHQLSQRNPERSEGSWRAVECRSTTHPAPRSFVAVAPSKDTARGNGVRLHSGRRPPRC